MIIGGLTDLSDNRGVDRVTSVLYRGFLETDTGPSDVFRLKEISEIITSFLYCEDQEKICHQ